MIKRIGVLADGWFVLCSPEDFPQLNGKIQAAAEGAGRDSAAIGTEAGVAVVGPREDEWRERVTAWHKIGLSHLCLRTLGGGLRPYQHLDRLKEICDQIPQAIGG